MKIKAITVEKLIKELTPFVGKKKHVYAYAVDNDGDMALLPVETVGSSVDCNVPDDSPIIYLHEIS